MPIESLPRPHHHGASQQPAREEITAKAPALALRRRLVETLQLNGTSTRFARDHGARCTNANWRTTNHACNPDLITVAAASIAVYMVRWTPR